MVCKLGRLLALVLWAGLMIDAPAPCAAQDLQKALRSGEPAEPKALPGVTEDFDTPEPDEPYEAPPKSRFSWYPEPVINEIDPRDYPLLERPGLESSWFGQVDTTLAMPHIRNNLTSQSPIGGNFPNPLQLPVAQLNFAAMPRFQLGYRRPRGLGEFLVSYRFLFSQGTEQLASVDALGGGTVTSRLQAHVLDLEYGITEYSEGNHPFFAPIFRWTAGVRVAGTSLSSQVQGKQVLDQQMKNQFVGAGPLVSLLATWPIPDSCFSFYTHATSAGVIGPCRQRFSETDALTGGGTQSGYPATDPSVVAVPVVNVQAGVNWVPGWYDGRLRFTGGYQWERWWNLGVDTNSYLEMTLQGPFLRGELVF